MKLLPISIFFVLCTIVTVNGQHSVQKIPPVNRAWAGFAFSPELGYRRLENTEGTEYLDFVIHFRDSTETPRWGYTTGLCLYFPIENIWGIETGFQYSNTRFMRIQTTRDTTLVTGQLIKQTSFFNYHYVNFPIKIRFQLGSKKIRFTSTAGLSFNNFIKDTQCHTYDYYKSESTEKKGETGFKYHQFAVVPTFSLGIMYVVQPKLMIVLEPTIRYGVSQTVKQPITNYLYSAGLNMGIYFR